jgi:hypothetical protein
MPQAKNVHRPIARKLRVAVFHSYSHRLLYAYIYSMKGETSIGESRQLVWHFVLRLLFVSAFPYSKLLFWVGYSSLLAGRRWTNAYLLQSMQKGSTWKDLATQYADIFSITTIRSRLKSPTRSTQQAALRTLYMLPRLWYDVFIRGSCSCLAMAV